METIEITKANAVEAYKAADVKGKEMLSKLLGKTHFGSPHEWATTWAEVCMIEGINPVGSMPYREPESEIQEAVNGHFKAMIITKVFNEGWVPDYNNSSEQKWELWINLSGGGFSLYGVGFTRTRTCCGARLVFQTRAKALAAFKAFPDVYRSFMSF